MAASNIPQVGIWGVVAEVIFSVALFISDEVVSGGQLLTIRAQNEKIIALDKKLEPRTLSDEQQAKLVNVTRWFAGQKYILSLAVGSETAQFTCVLDKVLKDAGWVRAVVPSYGFTTTPCESAGNTAVNLLSGVHIRVKPAAKPEVAEAGVALWKELEADDIEAYTEVDPVNIQDAANIAVMVGTKL